MEFTNVAELVTRIATEIGLKFSFREGKEQSWENLLHLAEYIPYDYTSASIDYQLCYQLGHGGEWHDVSLLLLWDNRAVGVWPLTVSRQNLITKITSQGQPLNPPLFLKGLNPTIKRKLIILSIELLYKTCSVFNITELRSSERFSNQFGVSLWQSVAMSRGARCDVQHDLYLNILSTIDLIQQNFRPRLRNDIKRGSSWWNCELITANSLNIDNSWADFKLLHYIVSGKITKNDRCWELQKEEIKNNSAFLIRLTDKDNKMVGGGYFTLTRDEGVYSVGAYDRDMFDKPLGHLVQFEAIKEFVRRKITWYKIGNYSYIGDTPSPNKKEISIGEFKKQFSSHLFHRIILDHML
jgi:FemAB family protein